MLITIIWYPFVAKYTTWCATWLWYVQCPSNESINNIPTFFTWVKAYTHSITLHGQDVFCAQAMQGMSVMAWAEMRWVRPTDDGRWMWKKGWVEGICSLDDVELRGSVKFQLPKNKQNESKTFYSYLRLQPIFHVSRGVCQAILVMLQAQHDYEQLSASGWRIWKGTPQPRRPRDPKRSLPWSALILPWFRMVSVCPKTASCAPQIPQWFHSYGSMMDQHKMKAVWAGMCRLWALSL